MDKLFILLLSSFYLCSAKIKINNLNVPSAILYGSQTDVVLDCDFTSGDHTVTEIKWFLDGDKQIYQWLPKTNVPAQALGKLKDHIDLSYRATNNKDTMYRALHITDLTPEFSGNYTCKVSGPESEDEVTKSMIIYETPDDDLELTISEEESEIICSADGLFPQPNMTLYITDLNETSILYQEDDELIDRDEDGLFNVSSILVYDPEVLTETFYYICELSIPGTPFSINETRIHKLDNDETRPEEDMIFNSTNSTESAFQESKASSEHPNILQNGFLIIHICCQESSSYRKLPSLVLSLSAVILLSL